METSFIWAGNPHPDDTEVEQAQDFPRTSESPQADLNRLDLRQMIQRKILGTGDFSSMISAKAYLPLSVIREKETAQRRYTKICELVVSRLAEGRTSEAEAFIDSALRGHPYLREPLLLLQLYRLLLQGKEDELRSLLNSSELNAPENNEIRLQVTCLKAISEGSYEDYDQAFRTINEYQRNTDLKVAMFLELAICLQDPMELERVVNTIAPGTNDLNDPFKLVRDCLKLCLAVPGVQPEDEVQCKLLLANHPDTGLSPAIDYVYHAARKLLSINKPSLALLRTCCQSYERFIYFPFTRDFSFLENERMRQYAVFAIGQQVKLYLETDQSKKAERAYQAALACHERLKVHFPKSAEGFNLEEMRDAIETIHHNRIGEMLLKPSVATESERF